MNGETYNGDYFGAPEYQPPEMQRYNRRDYVPASSDIFAAGCILFAMYSGRLPFGLPTRGDDFYRYIFNGNYD